MFEYQTMRLFKFAYIYSFKNICIYLFFFDSHFWSLNHISLYCTCYIFLIFNFLWLPYLNWSSETKMAYRCTCHAKSLQFCSTLCDPLDCSPPGFSVGGILQIRILEWVTMPSSRGSTQSRNQIHIPHISCISRWVLYHYCHLGSPIFFVKNFNILYLIL